MNDPAALIHVFEMMVERLSIVELKLTSMENRQLVQQRFDANHADNGKYIDGGLYDWHGASIRKCYSGSSHCGGYFAITLDNYNIGDDVYIEEEWANGSISWVDALLLKAIDHDTIEGIRIRVRTKLDELEELSKIDESIVEWNITCASIECTDILSARPTDEVGIALVRAALKEESGGLITDIDDDSSTIFIRAPSAPGSWCLDDTIRIAMQGLKRLVPTNEFNKLKMSVYKIDPFIAFIAFDTKRLQRSQSEMTTQLQGMTLDQIRSLKKLANSIPEDCSFFYQIRKTLNSKLDIFR